MKRDIVWTTQFKKDYKLALKRHLDSARKFYLCYQNQISKAVFRKFAEEKTISGGKV